MFQRRARVPVRRRGVAFAPLVAVVLVGAASERGRAQDVGAPDARPSSDGLPRGVVDLPRLSGTIDLDGPSDEAAWVGITPLTLTMYEPTFRGESDRRIEMLVAYDDEALYVAARFYHDDPATIRAFTLTRDRWSGDDTFGVLLDTFNDNENALRFVALPLGARMDMSVTGDGQDGGGASGPRGTSWNTFWDLETRITDEGWFGELRIPFSSLRFETQPDGSVVMGMMAYAYEPADGLRWTFPAIPPRFPYTQVSAWQDVRLTGVTPRNPIYVSPYGLTGTSHTTELSEAGDRWIGTDDEDFEAGVDVKINPTPNLTLDLTVNTDFAAVEADAEQVNLTRFSLFFDEKRPFFQERAGIFGFDTGTERGTLFYSRRIGLVEGEPIRILGGARLVGRVGSWDLGVIDMQTARQGGLPSENFGVVRLRRRVLNPNSFVGGMATSRVDEHGDYTVTYGLDGQFRVAGDEYVTLKWLQTFDDQAEAIPGDDAGGIGGEPLAPASSDGLESVRVVLDWTRRRLEGFSYRQAFTWSGSGFSPAMGFEERSDFTRVQSDWNYQWYPDEASAFRRVWLGNQANVWWRNQDGNVDTGLFRPFLHFESKPGTTLILSTRTRYEDVPVEFGLSEDARIPEGRYWATEGVVEFMAPRGWTFRPNVTVEAGQFFDGTRTGVRSRMDWPLSRHLEIGGEWEWDRIRFEERGQEFRSNLFRVRARGAVDARLSLNAFIQYNSLTERVTTNARFRYQFREGQDLWLVWNEGLNLERNLPGQPRLPLESARTLTVKYTHTLIF